jgi:hypothetical protein
MWVRVATFEGGDTQKLDKLMDERMSSGEMTPPQGMSSVLILDDKDAKKRKFLAFFDSRDALDAAEAGFDQQATRSRRRSAASAQASTTTTSPFTTARSKRPRPPCQPA